MSRWMIWTLVIFGVFISKAVSYYLTNKFSLESVMDAIYFSGLALVLHYWWGES